MKPILFAIIIALMFSGCADSITFDQAEHATKIGFWYGLWHGMIFPFAWLVSLFDSSVSIYAIYNNGGWYDFGFFIGVGGFSASMHSTSNYK